MQIVREVGELRSAVRELRARGGKLALVPTMGALHAGHIALVERALLLADQAVASVFVNPKQFGANEDLGSYPRRETEDSEMLRAAGVRLLWMPAPDAMYPAGFGTSVSVAGLGDVLDGAARPGHFDGVATVVAKLFNQVRPDLALFGEKDWQQLQVVRRMAADLDLGVEVVGAPTVREADGLAMSSRNAYLTPGERAGARALPDALARAKERIEADEDAAAALAEAGQRLLNAGFSSIDYVELRDAETLGEPRPGRPARLLAAARLGRARLIDNWPIELK